MQQKDGVESQRDEVNHSDYGDDGMDVEVVPRGLKSDWVSIIAMFESLDMLLGCLSLFFSNNPNEGSDRTVGEGVRPVRLQFLCYDDV